MMFCKLVPGQWLLARSESLGVSHNVSELWFYELCWYGDSNKTSLVAIDDVQGFRRNGVQRYFETIELQFILTVSLSA